jgi:phage gp45-like
MNRDTSPREHATDTAQIQQAYSFLDVGVVTSAPIQTEDGQHHVTVAETRVPSDQPIPVVPPVHGDYYVPPEGVPVLVAYTDENEAVAVGAPIPEADKPSLKAGERVISHPLSTAAVVFDEDGGITITDDDETQIHADADGKCRVKASEATVTVTKQGTIEATAADGTSVTVANQTLTVNNGSTPVVTDVSISSTNSDGGATSLSVETNDSVQL